MRGIFTLPVTSSTSTSFCVIFWLGFNANIGVSIGVPIVSVGYMCFSFSHVSSMFYRRLDC